MKMQQRISLALLALYWTGTASTVLAAENISSAPVEWTADGEFTVRIENDIRIVELQENVQVTQGGLEISGDQAIFEYTADTNDLIRVTVHGTPVQYQQAQENSEQLVTGSSDTIILYEDELTNNTLVELKGNATIQTADSITNCVELIYDTVLNIIPSSTPPCRGSLTSTPN